MGSDTELTALTRASSMGSKLVIAGATAAVSSALVLWLLQAGQDLGTVEFMGVKLPARFAVMPLGVLSGAAGWAGWAYLRQGQRLLYRLEFNTGVEPDEIRTSLTGSSLASASVLLLRALCFLGIIALSVPGPYFGVTNLLSGLGLELGIPFGLYWIFPLLIVLPYLLIMFAMPRLRYLNPDNWVRGSWFFFLMTKFEGPVFDARSNLTGAGLKLPEDVASFDPDAFYSELESSVPVIYAAGVHTSMRKFGFRIFWPGQMDRLIPAELERACMREADRILKKMLKHANPQARTALRRQLLGA